MINFLRYKTIYFLVSAVVIGVGLFSMIQYGFQFSIDFVGGSFLEYQIQPNPDRKIVRSILSKEGVDVSSVIVSNDQVSIRSKPIDEKKQEMIKTHLAKEYKTITVLRFETVGPTLGKETVQKTITASMVAVLVILLYLTFAFRNIVFGLAAVLAVIHDLLVLFGSYSLLSHFFGAEFDILFVTAILTTMSFSVHDTIVVFDKIREYRRRDRATPFALQANKALTETMVRSFNNSLTIILMLTALVLLGGEVIRFFVIALLIGTITGTYSSPFVAVPLLEILEKRRK